MGRSMTAAQGECAAQGDCAAVLIRWAMPTLLLLRRATELGGYDKVSAFPRANVARGDAVFLERWRRLGGTKTGSAGVPDLNNPGPLPDGRGTDQVGDAHPTAVLRY